MFSLESRIHLDREKLIFQCYSYCGEYNQGVGVSDDYGR